MTPEKWAFQLTHILGHIPAEERFPIDVEKLARQYSAQRFPNDAITAVKGKPLVGFEGMLQPAPVPHKGWGIFYNTAVSAGRQRFTMAHELGHYLVHRLQYPDGFRCTTEDMLAFDPEYREIERQANVFAANLLMPLDDFRAHIPDRESPDLRKLGRVARTYGVSLSAACHRWMEYTSSRSCLVFSRDGFIMRARSSDSAFSSGIYIKTKNVPPVEVPEGSLAAAPDRPGLIGTAAHPTGVWFAEPCVESRMSSDRYGLTISLIHMGSLSNVSLEEDPIQDMFDRLVS
jgi:hypothetical protein